MNDIPNTSTQMETLLFPDDTNIYFSHSDINQVQIVRNKKLDSIAMWMKANK